MHIILKWCASDFGAIWIANVRLVDCSIDDEHTQKLATYACVNADRTKKKGATTKHTYNLPNNTIDQIMLMVYN